MWDACILTLVVFSHKMLVLILVKKCCRSRIYELAVKSEGKELEKWLSVLGYAVSLSCLSYQRHPLIDFNKNLMAN